MSKLKMHYKTTDMYNSVCGSNIFNYTRDVTKVTCESCKKTEAYKVANIKALAKRVKTAKISLDEEIDTVTESYEFRQQQWLKENDIKIGDKVKVLRSALDRECGWSTVWNEDMDRYVRLELTIEHIDSCFGCFSNNYYYPYFVLEKVVNETATKDAEVDSLLYAVTNQLWDFISDHTNYNTFKSDCEKGEIYCIEEMIPERVFKIKVTEVELIEKDSNDR
jgi:hypothetical protein